jgi:hypothetical protein
MTCYFSRKSYGRVREVCLLNGDLFTTLICIFIQGLDKDLHRFVLDASKFLSTFWEPIAHSVPHIYLSALPFTPKESLIWGYHHKIFPNLICVLDG